MTGVGVEAVVEGCSKLEIFDVSQCKNLRGWLEGGGRERWEGRWNTSRGIGSGKRSTRGAGRSGVADKGKGNLVFWTEKGSGPGVGLR